jgi:transposase
MSATHNLNSTASFAPVLYVAFELSSGQWKLASTTARGQRARVVSVQARNTAAVLREIARAKARFGVAESAVVFSCNEAGRDGFWLHRCLHHHGINNVIVDSSSIEVNRRARRAKADGLDAVSLVGLLARYGEGETNVWSTVSVPDPADEIKALEIEQAEQIRDDQTRHVDKLRTLMGLSRHRRFRGFLTRMVCEGPIFERHCGDVRRLCRSCPTICLKS